MPDDAFERHVAETLGAGRERWGMTARRAGQLIGAHEIARVAVLLVARPDAYH